MASEVTIAPTLGHPLLFTQGGVGATPGYDAIDLRRMMEASSSGQEGVFDATGWRVRENTLGPNMTVQVDVNVGLARVKGDSVTFQSDYIVAPHSGVATLDITAAHSTNPRVDMVVLQVRDNTHDALGQNDVRVMILTGTPTAGATIDNLNGQVSLPANALRLADVHVPATDTTIANAQIRDRRKWAKGAFRVIERSSGNYNTTSASLAAVDATNLSPRIECSGVPMRIALLADVMHSAVNGRVLVEVFVDGAQVGLQRTSGGRAATYGTTGVLDTEYTPSAGSHVFQPRFALAEAGTATLVAAASSKLYYVLQEIVCPNADNGTN